VLIVFTVIVSFSVLFVAFFEEFDDLAAAGFL
jgi:hypothetical protein